MPPTYISEKSSLAVAAVNAIHSGDLPALKRLLAENPGLAKSQIGSPDTMARSLLHVATDWPGHFPNGVETVRALIEAGAEVDARFVGPHNETPLHWAASSNDVEVLDALLDAGADIEAAGGVIGGGPPLGDATAFAQWKAARRLVERGAKTELFAHATLGLMDRLERDLAGGASLSSEQIGDALWGACHGGQRAAAELLLARGAELNWIPGWEPLTPLDAAKRNGFEELAAWLRAKGGRSAKEMQ